MFWEYLKAVFIKNGLILLIGFFETIPWLIRPLIPDRLKKNIDKFISPTEAKCLGIAALIVAFTVSNYWAWETQKNQVEFEKAKYNKLSEKYQKLPSLNLTIAYNGYLCSETENSLTLYLHLSLKNMGAMNRTARWFLLVGNNRILPTRIKDVENLYDGRHKIAHFRKSNRIEDKTIELLQEGSLVEGWLKFELKGIRLDQLQKAQKIIGVEDIYNNQYYLDIDLIPTKDYRYENHALTGK